MVVLVTYDVATDDRAGTRRLRRVAQVCKDYGTRAQKSVFECLVGDKEWALLRSRLLDEMDMTKDSIRFYFLDQAAVAKTETHGRDSKVDFAEPIVV